MMTRKPIEFVPTDLLLQRTVRRFDAINLRAAQSDPSPRASYLGGTISYRTGAIQRFFSDRRAQIIGETPVPRPCLASSVQLGLLAKWRRAPRPPQRNPP